jgi:NAD(P)-dependent dehydrogenase (short-subunit alcohol dehydrogenase family)
MIIISGASGKIGNYLTKKYCLKETVFGTYYSGTRRDDLYYVDICDYSSVIKFYEQIESKLEKITLINCAGISYNSFAHKSDPAEWRRVVETNLFGIYHMIRAFLPIMRIQNYGRIINLSSVVVQKATPGISAYAASKSALLGLIKTLCVENGSKNITINNINLGYSKIGMGVDDVPLLYQDIIKSQIPSKEFCGPEDIYNTVEYIRSTKYLNGSSIDLNGGLI